MISRKMLMCRFHDVMIKIDNSLFNLFSINSINWDKSSWLPDRFQFLSRGIIISSACCQSLNIIIQCSNSFWILDYATEEAVSEWPSQNSESISEQRHQERDRGVEGKVRTGQIQLWEFLKQLLSIPQYHSVIRWVKRDEGNFAWEP